MTEERQPNTELREKAANWPLTSHLSNLPPDDGRLWRTWDVVAFAASIQAEAQQQNCPVCLSPGPCQHRPSSGVGLIRGTQALIVTSGECRCSCNPGCGCVCHREAQQKIEEVWKLLTDSGVGFDPESPESLAGRVQMLINWKNNAEYGFSYNTKRAEAAEKELAEARAQAEALKECRRIYGDALGKVVNVQMFDHTPEWIIEWLRHVAGEAICHGDRAMDAAALERAGDIKAQTVEAFEIHNRFCGENGEPCQVCRLKAEREGK